VVSWQRPRPISFTRSVISYEAFENDKWSHENRGRRRLPVTTTFWAAKSVKKSGPTKDSRLTVLRLGTGARSLQVVLDDSGPPRGLSLPSRQDLPGQPVQVEQLVCTQRWWEDGPFARDPQD